MLWTCDCDEGREHCPHSAGCPDCGCRPPPLPLVIASGDVIPVLFVDYICTISIEKVASGKHGRELSGKVRTECPFCGRVHDVLKHYCEIEFEQSKCQLCILYCHRVL